MLALRPPRFDWIHSMKTFIRVVELWVPDRTRTRLEFGGGLGGGAFSEFTALSENTLFAYDEGLPGKAWACGHPIVLTEFSAAEYKRSDDAKEAGLSCGVALPVFAGEFLMAVMVLALGATGLLAAADVDGLLVGGASLDAEGWSAIVRA